MRHLKENNKKGFTPTPKFGVARQRRGGFTLMEIIVAVAVIAIALGASIALISFSVSGIITGKSKIIATNLAQEGLEIVRNIRDSNWVSYKRSPDNWREGLGQGNWRVQYNRTELLYAASTPLRVNSAGFYQYDQGTDSLFYRRINIQHIGDNQIKVTAQITWQEKGRSQSIVVEDRLYNWLEE